MNLFRKVRKFNPTELIELQIAASSKGNQRKWYHSKEHLFIKEQFIYQNKQWKDYLVELIASALAEQMSLCGSQVVKQLEGRVSGRPCVYSKDFCTSGERDIGLARLEPMLGEHIQKIDRIEKRWDLVLSAIEKHTGLDYENYLVIMSLIDYLVGNEDRHLNNICVVSTEGSFREAPLFDFGLGLFEHDRIYERVPFRQCLKQMIIKPFAHDGEETIEWLRCNYNLNKWLPKEFNLQGIELPSPKAGSYLLNRCRLLGIELRGVG